ncbi:MAG: hypothetical protein ABI810_06380 [Sphingomonas bacterium]
MDSARDDLPERRLDAGEILARLGEILWTNKGFTLGCVAGLSVINVAAQQVSSGLVAMVPGAIGAVIAHYYLIATALKRLGLCKAGTPNRFWDFWGLLILSGFCVLCGFAALIVPGLYINARWAAAGPVLVSGDSQVGAALDKSWAMSGPSAWAIVATWLMIYVPIVLIGVILVGVLEFSLPVLGQPVVQVFLSSGAVTAWLMGVAVYSLLRPPTAHLAQVFA